MGGREFNDLIILPSRDYLKTFTRHATMRLWRKGIHGSLTRDISYNSRTHSGGDDGPGATASLPADKAAGRVVGLLTGRRR